MSDPLPKEELEALAAELEPQRPHPDLPEVLAPGSNVAYLPKDQHDLVMAMARGLGLFGRVSEHEHRLALERERRKA